MSNTRTPPEQRAGSAVPTPENQFPRCPYCGHQRFDHVLADAANRPPDADKEWPRTWESQRFILVACANLECRRVVGVLPYHIPFIDHLEALAKELASVKTKLSP